MVYDSIKKINSPDIVKELSRIGKYFNNLLYGHIR